jgi:3-dehydroquinate dehydratase-2
MAEILILNGPNLNQLGTRDPHFYGHETLGQIQARLTELATQFPHDLHFFQSNSEGELINRIQTAKSEGIAFIIINAGAFTHTSIALRDALAGAEIPCIEVHISNIFQREAFRHVSYLADIARGVIAGFGPYSYELALYAANQHLKNQVH